MNSVSATLRAALPQSVPAALQLGIAGLGTALILWSVLTFVRILLAMPPSESGFAEGLAILVFGLYVLLGFAVVALGLWIPQREGEGIQFSGRQRRLLAYGAVAPVGSVLLVPIGATLAPPLTGPVLSVAVAVLGGLLCSGPLATLIAVGLKLRE